MSEEPLPDEKRRDLDAIFGDVLPDTTSDERDPSSPDDSAEDWYRSNRPPHHGG
ncbi:hypothetical protein [Actinokineospora sp.]|uniref:hypothetical protein n=1 Tax=Actinokineospora sp. TaxID=1872133 RepID=UPI004037864E